MPARLFPHTERSDEELREIAREAAAGRIIGSWSVGTFTPLENKVFRNFDDSRMWALITRQFPTFYATEEAAQAAGSSYVPLVAYGHIEDAVPGATVEGFPVFETYSALGEEEWKRLLPMLRELGVELDIE